MRGGGLVELENPSEALLRERPIGAAGSVVVASAEGTRPLLVEVQGLVATPTGLPRRAALGVDPNRVSLLLAVLDRKAGIDVLSQDVFVNVAGGVRLEEPAIDLGVVCALASSASGRPCDPHTVVFGEVGLAGEIRAVGLGELRLAEAHRLGFRRCILPEPTRARLVAAGRPPIELCGVRDVQSALEAILAV
jgi:DNA repair protein RadA/Sms